MKTRHFVLTGMIVLALFCMVGLAAAQAGNTPVTANMTEAHVNGDEDDIAPYDGPIGAGNPLYGLKVAMEDLDETFTFNQSQRMEKQLNHARLRIAEVRRELAINRTDTAQQALDLYLQKMNLTEHSLVSYRSNDTGLLHAQGMIIKHQLVLGKLLLSYPNNTGLSRAYNNSLALEQKFEEKTAIRFERIIEKNNKTILKAIRLEIKGRDRTGAGDIGHAATEAQTRNEQSQQSRVEQQDKNGLQKKGTPVPPVITTQPSQTQSTPTQAATTQQDQKPSNGQAAGKPGMGNTDETGRGNSRNK